MVRGEGEGGGRTDGHACHSHETVDLLRCGSITLKASLFHANHGLSDPLNIGGWYSSEVPFTSTDFQ